MIEVARVRDHRGGGAGKVIRPPARWAANIACTAWSVDDGGKKRMLIMAAHRKNVGREKRGRSTQEERELFYAGQGGNDPSLFYFLMPLPLVAARYCC